MKTLFRSLSVFVALLLTAIPAFAVPDFAELAIRLKPSVVNISTSKTIRPQRPIFPGQPSPYNEFFEEFFDRFFRGQPMDRKERSLGSGFIISADGYILTNDHVVDGADVIKVRLSDGREFNGTVQGLDPKLDLALIKIDVGQEELPVAEMGNSETLKVGEWVMAIGNPFGLEQTVTVGIVSAKGRVIGAGPYDDFIQTDASINPGNSGGPLFNEAGKVIGINTAIVAGGQGIGFAIPINAAKSIIPQLRETGHVVRGWIGVTVQELTEELAESFGLKKARGALVTDVEDDSPARKAGLQRGDIILEINGQTLENLSDLPRIVAALPVGAKARMTLFRDGRTKEASVTIGTQDRDQQPAKREVAKSKNLLGLSVIDITPEIKSRYRLSVEKGVLVAAVEADGPAAGTLHAGDVILELNGEPVESAAALHALLGNSKSNQLVRLLVQRRDQTLYATVRTR
ncbi:DegQ family serine endoprotease [Syntrophotalea acetylenica]|uniref:Probable periplasmic serine endoprotease DegP-like n=1 Tax=Syntrophotalea acetylenica TaxID=29542 RepID=A0A1L3GFK7_SYNAC|nr:DegQ family serine endoprotease [Syntrophotalea acetylenica]APG24670.1 peptidase [Syntrophotalea acetylenica]APG42720.1 peptidase [Syntrophotalea acetylenica]MDY0262169.1 DegQ family serine endoprotease [Syntrophotalea acetylenica]